ncbi:MAG: hypothetical protein F4X65_08675 [Chloroflexi bacterium]|nr:hypothetical protein [Chloroflexota bacterium]
MDNDEFIQRIREKIERLTESRIDLHIDLEDVNRLEVELGPEVPQVMLGANIYNYSGFARMGVEYAVASIRERRNIEPMEFHLLLARN